MRIPKLRDQFLLLLKTAILTERRSKIVCKIKDRRERSAEGRRKGHCLTGSEEISQGKYNAGTHVNERKRLRRKKF